jgi:valyl-tRNA synthetase
VPVSEQWCQGSRNFCNKLWNATRFALQNGATIAAPLREADELSGADRWIVSRLTAVIAEVDGYYEDFQFGKVADCLYHFAWDEVCDWYLELAKQQLAGPAGVASGTRLVLGHLLDQLLRLLHPLVPFVTEELWTVLAAGRGGAPSLVVAAWPGSDPTRRDLAAESEIAALRQAVTEVRRFRAEQGLKPGQDVPARLSYDPAARPDLAGHERHLRALTKLVAPADPAGLVPTATVTAAGVTVDLDLAGVIDMTAQRNRLTRELAAAVQEAERAAAKLANPAFLANAPPPVVAKIRERLDAARSDLDRLDRQLSELPVGSATGTDR